MNLTIKKLEREELSTLEKAIPFGKMINPHPIRLREQEKGNALYLIAWLDKKIIGHIFLRFDGAKDRIIKNKIKKCAHIEAAAIISEFQGRGFGTKLIKKCESISKNKGFKKIGMAVSIDNEGAFNLYKRLGYKDIGLGSFKTGWFVKDKNGKRKKEFETCIYLVKKL